MNDSISIIIPTYNRRVLLKETLDSILSQKLRPFEVIVVDDHSTDGTVEWLRQEFAEEIIVIANEGKGPGAARNTGYKRSTGRYVKFFDSDDIMTKNTLQLQYNKLLESNKAFVYSPYFYASQSSDGTWNTKDATILNYYPFPTRQGLTHWMARGLFIAIPAMMFTRELLDEIGPWRTDITTYEDWDYLWRISLYEANPEHVNTCAFIYRQHDNQSTLDHFSNKERDREASIMFKTIITEYSGSLSSIDKRFLRYMWKKVSTEGFSNSYFWESIIFRGYQKISRIRSGSKNWMHFYGAYESQELVDLYLEMI